MAYQIAQAYALREDADNMFKWLDPAHATHDGGLERLLAEPFFKPYWYEPRFVAVARRLGFQATLQVGERPGEGARDSPLQLNGVGVAPTRQRGQVLVCRARETEAREVHRTDGRCRGET